MARTGNLHSIARLIAREARSVPRMGTRCRHPKAARVHWPEQDDDGVLRDGSWCSKCGAMKRLSGAWVFPKEYGAR
jgi:hypothetical protein